MNPGTEFYVPEQDRDLPKSTEAWQYMYETYKTYKQPHIGSVLQDGYSNVLPKNMIWKNGMIISS